MIKLIEADEFEDEIESEEIDDITDDADSNELVKKEISFPILIESFDEEGNAIEADDADIEELTTQYADTVIDNFNDNKKFILSALDIYDFEIYFDELDTNSNIHFIVELNEDVPNDKLNNTIKRYFDVDVDDLEVSYGIISIRPVLENKYLTIT